MSVATTSSPSSKPPARAWEEVHLGLLLLSSTDHGGGEVSTAAAVALAWSRSPAAASPGLYVTGSVPLRRRRWCGPEKRRGDAEELGAVPARRSDVHGFSRLASTATMRFDGRRELLKEKKRWKGCRQFGSALILHAANLGGALIWFCVLRLYVAEARRRVR